MALCLSVSVGEPTSPTCRFSPHVHRLSRKWLHSVVRYWVLKILFKYLLKWELSDLTSLQSIIEKLNLLLSSVDIDESRLGISICVKTHRYGSFFFFYVLFYHYDEGKYCSKMSY